MGIGELYYCIDYRVMHGWCASAVQTHNLPLLLTESREVFSVMGQVGTSVFNALVVLRL